MICVHAVFHGLMSMVTIHEAVRELRKVYGESQQAFATRLGLSMRAVANYENKRNPDTRSLIRLTNAAREVGREDLIREFLSATEEAEEHLAFFSNRDELLWTSVGKELVKQNGPGWAFEEVKKAITNRKKDIAEYKENNPGLELDKDRYFMGFNRALQRLEGLREAIRRENPILFEIDKEQIDKERERK